MANGRSSASIRNIGWKPLLAGAVLTFVLLLLAELVARAVGTAVVAIGLSTAAFFLAGHLAARFVPEARPIEPALGSGLVVLVLGLLQFSAPRAEAPATTTQIVLFTALVAVMAFVLAFLGARLARTLQMRRSSF